MGREGGLQHFLDVAKNLSWPWCCRRDPNLPDQELRGVGEPWRSPAQRRTPGVPEIGGARGVAAGRARQRGFLLQEMRLKHELRVIHNEKAS